MSNELQTSPLMSPILWNGQTYFTSHYFHQQYRANKSEGGKYARQKDFMRLIRSIEAYPQYIERGDIVELEYKPLKDLTGAEFAPVKQAFMENGYNPIMLINATAQVALTHHLDDEISKSVSVEVNAQATSKDKRKTRKLMDVTDFYLGLAKSMSDMLGMNISLAVAGALGDIQEATGLRTENLRRALPAADPVKVGRLNPTELGERIGENARTINQMLCKAGLQTKENDEWRLTEEGSTYAELVPYKRNGHSSYQILWNESVLNVLKGSDYAQ